MTRTNNIYRKNAGKIIITILLAALAFIVLYPFIWMLVTSFKPRLYPIRQSCFREGSVWIPISISGSGFHF